MKGWSSIWSGHSASCNCLLVVCLAQLGTLRALHSSCCLRDGCDASGPRTECVCQVPCTVPKRPVFEPPFRHVDWKFVKGCHCGPRNADSKQVQGLAERSEFKSHLLHQYHFAHLNVSTVSQYLFILFPIPLMAMSTKLRNPLLLTLQ